MNPVNQFVMHYGAATQIDADTISADGRVAVSSDGRTFVDLGAVVLDHLNPALQGYGDEIFPQAGYSYQGQNYVSMFPTAAQHRGIWRSRGGRPSPRCPSQPRWSMAMTGIPPISPPT